MERLIESGEDSREGFARELRESVGMAQYLHSRQDEENYLRAMAKGQYPFQDFVGLCAEHWTRDERKIVLRYLLEEFERTQQTQMNEETPTGLYWSSSRNVRWVRTDSVFVAFSDKSAADDLLSVLSESLKDWAPDPSTLFLMKIRASMDEYGVVNQARVLKHRNALALWYKNLLSREDVERRSLIAESVSRHSDRLMDAILPLVTDFAERLVDDEPNECANATAKKHYDVDLSNEQKRKQAALSHNAFVCSKPPEGWHLSTGHVFEMDGDRWICLSPACDMVPSQISSSRIKELGNRLPFISVRLTPMPDGKLPDAIKIFRFNPHDAGSAPDWTILYAENRGKFSQDFQFSVIRVEDDGKGGITGTTRDAQVVGQLRYEYALNLVHKLGGSLTRVGLDFSDGRSG